MKTVAAFALAHPVAALVVFWGVNWTIRGMVARATGYDALAVAVDGLKLEAKRQQWKAKARP